MTPPPPKPTPLKDTVCVGWRCSTPVDHSRKRCRFLIRCRSVPRRGLTLAMSTRLLPGVAVALVAEQLEKESQEQDDEEEERRRGEGVVLHGDLI